MSREIERQVAALEFDVSEFSAGINTALKDVDRIKAGLKLDGAIKGFSDLDKASKRVDFNPLGGAVESVTTRLSSMGIIGFTVINRLTNAVIDGTKRIFDALVVNPLKSGLEEYETQINAIQTILSNTRTKGTVLEDVTNALDELNKYADLTIYNFTEMTKNIGTFTAAGVDLETSVSAIKGIANLAAVSGSSSQQASVAMYQLSQAISSGTVKLMDWNSVVNAGMGGELFKSLLIQFGEVSGTIEKGTVSSSNFRESLQDGWLTSEVLLSTLQAISGELDHMDLVQMGFTDAQAAQILATAKDAEAAATEIKTVTQLVDVAIEAMQSGWSQTWRMLIGDFEQAKELFGSIGSIITGVIEQSAEARNRFFNVFVVRGGRELAIKILEDGLNTLINVVNLFKSATADVFKPFKGFQLYNIVKGIADFVEKLKMASESGTRFQSIIRGIASILDIVKIFILAVLSPILQLKDGMLDSADGFIDMLAAAGDWLFGLRNVIKETDYFGTVVDKVLGYIRNGISVFRDWLDQFLKLEPVQDLVRALQSIEKSHFVSILTGFKNALIGVAYVIGGAVLGIKNLLQAIASITPIRNFLDYLGRTFTYDNLKAFIQYLSDQVPFVQQQFQILLSWLGEVGAKAREFVSRFKASDAVREFLDYINSLDGSRLRGFFSDLRDKLGWLPPIFAAIKSGLSGLGDLASLILPKLKELGSAIGDAISDVFAYLNNSDNNISFTGLANVINAGLLGAILLGVRKVLSGGALKNLLDRFIGEDSPLISSITDTFETLQNALTSWQNNLKADTIKQIAIAIGIVAASALALSLIDQNKLIGAVTAMGVLMTQLFGGAAILSRLDFKGIGSATAAIIGLSAGLLILSIAVKAFSTMDTDELTRGLTAIGIGLAGFIIAVKAMGIGGMPTGMIKMGVALGVLSASMLLLALAVKEFGDIPYDTVTDGMLRIGVALIGFIAFSKLASGHETILAALALGGLAGAIIILARGMEEMGNIPWENMVRGLVGLAGTLLILGIAVKAMSGSLAGSAAIVVASAAVLILAYSMKVLGELSWEEILRALVALGGVFLVIGLAGLLLGPLVPVLIGLAAAIALIGVGALALGAGVALAAAGLVLLAGSAAAIAVAIGIVGGAIGLVLPTIATALAEALANFLQTLADNAPKLFEAGTTLLLGLVDSVVEASPYILEAILEMIQTFLDLLEEHIPNFVETGFEILIGFLKGIEDNIQEVVETAVNIATEFIHGLTDSIPDLVDAGYGFVEALVVAIVDGLAERAPRLLTAAIDAGANLVAGMVQAIWNGLQSVINAASGLAAAALQAFKDVFELNSPAHTTIEIGGYVVAGLVIALKRGVKAVKNAATNLVEEAQNGMNLAVRKASNIINDNLSIDPVITPVINMVPFEDGVASMNAALAGAGSASAIKLSSSFSSRSGIGRDVTNDGATMPNARESDRGVTYNQYNYSPKALTTTEIYRRTRSQLARADKGGLS